MRLKQIVSLIAGAALLFYAALFPVQTVNAADITNRSLQLGTSTPSATTPHTFRFDYASTSNVGSVQFEYCSNSPVVGSSCTAPTGLNVDSVTLDSQTNETGFTIDPSLTNDNTIVLTRTPEAVTPVSSTYAFNGAINPSDSNRSFYVRITTYASTDATGPITDGGGIAISTGIDVDVTAFVPPYLEFCVGVVIFSHDCSTASGNLIDFGTLSESNIASGISKFSAGTNAFGGYTVIVTGNTLTSGNNVIPALSIPTNAQAGVPQFGINLRANTTPAVGLDPTGPGTAQPSSKYNNIDHFAFESGDELVESNVPNDRVTFTVSYIANVEPEQKIGNYTTTLTYICTGAF